MTSNLFFIQQHDEWNIPHHVDCALAMYGGMARLKDPEFVPFKNLEKYSNMYLSNLFVGSTEFMTKIFDFFEIKDKVMLPELSNRPYRLMTLAEAHELAKKGKIFVKPIQTKLFSGLVLTGAQYSCLDNIDPETKVIVYDYIHNIKSEWRGYVFKDKLIDCRFYSGDFRYVPDMNIELLLDRNRQAGFPIAYTIDLGVISDDGPEQETFVVEYNDFWAIGNYGLPVDIYFDMLEARYFEIMRGVK